MSRGGKRFKLALVVMALHSGIAGAAPAVAPEAQSPPAPSVPAQAENPEGSASTSVIAAKDIAFPIAVTTPIDPVPGDWEPTFVVLELSVDEHGDVTSAALLRGDDPFAAAALAHVKNWKFVPAKRNGNPVPVRFQYAVEFYPSRNPQKQVDHGPPSTEQPAAITRSPLKRAPEPIQEVTVLGDIPDRGATTITREETDNLAGAFGDPLRAIEVMPGVTPIATGLPLFFVRGAPPGNVGYFIDGMRVPLLYHFFLGPSVLHPGFIKEVSLSAGPMPTRFGRYAGGTLEAQLNEPNGEKKIEASVRLIDAGAFVRSPFADGKGYVQLAGRYSYTALLINLFSPGQRLDYWDYEGLVGYQISKRDELSFLGLGSFDYVGSDGEVIGGTEYHRADLRWAHQFSNDTSMRLAVTYGRDRTRSESGYISDRLVGTRANLEHYGNNFVFRSGADLWVDHYTLDVDPAIEEPEIFLELFPARDDVTGGIWADVVLFPHGNFQVIPGVRTDIFHSLGQTLVSVDPRITAEMQLTKKLHATHSLGVAHQSPNFVPNVPGAQVGGLNGGLQRSLQAASKYELQLPANFTGSVAGFINGTAQLTDPVGLSQSLRVDETSADKRSLGRAYGLEFFLKRSLTRRIGGLLSYTYSASLRSYSNINTPPGYDRPHVLNGAITYEIGKGWRASAKLAVASGIRGRRTTLEGFVFDQSRSRAYVRLDAKIAKRWVVNDHFDWGMQFELLNATATGNVTTRTCNSTECVNQGTAPITLPSLGFDFAWK